MNIPLQKIFPGILEVVWNEEIRRFASQRTVARLWARDASLWPHESSDETIIASNLSWLDLPEQIGRYIDASGAAARAAESEGLDHVVLVAMGGSNLGCAAILTFAGNCAAAHTHILDTTDPDSIRRLLSKIPLETTLYVVSSKSGKRLETHSLLLYFWTSSSPPVLSRLENILQR